VDNACFSWPEFGPRRARTANPMALETPKDRNALRIVFLGGSAAQGDPDPSFSMSRFLQCYFESVLPDRRVEIYNAGMTAVDSSLVLRSARDLLDLDPDLLIVYAGNNEFIGPSGVAAGQGFSRRKALLRRRMLGFRIAQFPAELKWKHRAEKGELGDWQGMESFIGLEVDSSDPRVDVIHRQFQSNLGAIVRAAGKKVPTILCTVGVNLLCPPFESMKGEEMEALFARLDEMEKTGRLQEALDAIAEAGETENALLAYRRGRILRALAAGGDEEGLLKAREALEHAVNLDRLRFRADSEINRVIRQEAAAGSNAYLADVENALSLETPIPGDDLFYDHVHLNFRGTDIAAREIFRVMREIPGLLPAESDTELPGRKKCAARLVFTGWSMLSIGGELQDRFSRPPFSEQFDHRGRKLRLESRMRQFKAYVTTPAKDAVRRLMIQRLEEHPDDWILHYDLGLLLDEMRHPEGAAVKMRTVLELRPTFDRAKQALASLELRMGRADEAGKLFEEVLRRHPYSFESLRGYGVSLLAAKDPRAGEVLRKALRLEPRDTATIYHLALHEAGQNRPEMAKELLRQLLQIDPTDDAASQLLRKLGP